jgi:hypothetical protein
MHNGTSKKVGEETRLCHMPFAFWRLCSLLNCLLLLSNSDSDHGYQVLQLFGAPFEIKLTNRTVQHLVQVTRDSSTPLLAYLLNAEVPDGAGVSACPSLSLHAQT